MKTFFATLLFTTLSGSLTEANAQDLALNKVNTINIASSTADISAFHIETQDGKSVFNWQASANEQVDRFELESSSDGRQFATIAYIFASEKASEEAYQYFAKSKQAKTQYRLKLILKDQSVTYSGIIIAHNEKHK